MSKIIPFFCLCWLIGCRVLTADPAVVLPSGDFSCTVEVTPRTPVPKADPAHPELRFAPVLKKIAIVQIGGVRCDNNTWSDGSVSKVWNILDKKLSVLVANNPAKDVVVLRGTIRDEMCPPLLHFDQDSVAWITKDALDKSSEAGGTGFHYQAKVRYPVNADPPAFRDFQAWIDPKTRVPLKFDDGSALYTLTFSPNAPSGPLIVPADVQIELDRWISASSVRAHR